MNSLTCFVPDSTLLTATPHCVLQRPQPPLTTYLTWSARIQTALLLAEQATSTAAATVAADEQDEMEQGLQIGEYSIGEKTDENLYGHPEIRY